MAERRDAMCWRIACKHENVSREAWVRLGIPSPAWHEPTALQRGVGGRSSPGG